MKRRQRRDSAKRRAVLAQTGSVDRGELAGMERMAG